jgi:hypothetical protein
MRESTKCEGCDRPVFIEPAVERETGQLYLFCPFCERNNFLPIIERESNPELKDIATDTEIVEEIVIKKRRRRVNGKKK